MSTPHPRNERLAAVIAELGLTYGGVARAVRQVAAENGDLTLRTNASAVGHWVRGRRTPSLSTVDYLVEALTRRAGRVCTPANLGLAGEALPGPATMDGDPVSVIAELGGADVHRREFLSSVVFSLPALALPLRVEVAGRAATAAVGGRCGRAEVEAVRQVTSAFTAADERLGGAHARSAVVEYLRTDATALLRGHYASDTDRRAMFGAVAELAYLCGWKAHDAGLDGRAQRYYLAAYQLAMEADPGPHAAYILRILAHQAFDLEVAGCHQLCRELADEALRRVRDRVDPATESLFWLTQARAAAVGDRTTMLAAIRRAEHAAGRDRDDPGPRWVALGGPAQARLANQTAKALTAAGDLAAAERHYRSAARCWNPVTHPRIRSLTWADVAETQARQGKLEQACDTWASALNGMSGIASARVQRTLDRIHAQTRPLRFPAAVDLRQRVATLASN